MHLRPKTRSAYESILRTHVQPRLGQVPVGTVTPMHVRRFVADMAEHGAAPGTIRNAYRLVHMLLGGAVHAGLIRSNPAFGIRLPQSERAEMVFLAPPQIARLADAVGEPYGFLVTFAAYTGLRAGEIAGLRRGRVDLDRRVLDVVETIAEADGRLVSGPTKTHQRRTVPLPESLAAELEQRLALRPLDPHALVFTAPDGGPVRHGNFYSRHFRPGVTRAGLPPMRFHDLRHSCAAMLIAQGAHPKAIAEMLGHSTITVTIDRYGRLFPSITPGTRRSHRRAPPSCTRRRRTAKSTPVRCSDGESGAVSTTCSELLGSGRESPWRPFASGTLVARRIRKRERIS